MDRGRLEVGLRSGQRSGQSFIWDIPQGVLFAIMCHKFFIFPSRFPYEVKFRRTIEPVLNRLPTNAAAKRRRCSGVRICIDP